MKKFTFLVLAVICLLCKAQTSPVEIKLWENGCDIKNGLELSKEGENPGFITSVSDPVLYVYPASKPNGTAVLMCPGGAYIGLAMNHEGKDMADWFNSMGITYAVLKYRMPNGNSIVPLTDGEKAMKILRDRAKEWGIDKNSIGIMGASAGGHFASTIATHYSSKDTRPDFQILFYPVITMEKGVTHEGSSINLLGQNPSEDLVNKFSNELQVTSDTPKAFIMVSSDDDVVPVENSIRYYNSLVKNGVPVTLHAYPSGGHGWGFRDAFPYKSAWTAELERWLNLEVIGNNK